jgi:hypothetical protein
LMASITPKPACPSTINPAIRVERTMLRLDRR